MLDRAARPGRGLLALAGAGGWELVWAGMALVVACWPPRGGWFGAGKGSAPWLWPVGARRGGWLRAG